MGLETTLTLSEMEDIYISCGRLIRTSFY